MEFARPLMWNVPPWAETVLYGLIPLVLLVVLAGIIWRVRRWAWGASEPGDCWLARLRRNLFSRQQSAAIVRDTFFQWRLSRDRYALAMHLAIFWGMAVLFLGTALATVDQDFANLPFDYQILTGRAYCLFELALDLFGIVLLVGLALAAYRRFVVQPPRLKLSVGGVSKWDAFPLRSILALIALTGFLAEGLRLAEGFQIEEQLAAVRSEDPADRLAVLQQSGVTQRFHRIGPQRRAAELQRIAEQLRVFPAAAWAPVGYGLGRLLTQLSTGALLLLHQAAWWTHAVLAFVFLAAIPFTKAFHLISSPLNILMRDYAAAVGRLPVTAESGVAALNDLTWRQLLQIDACTGCGKCHEVCPGQASGFPLSPRDVVQRLQKMLVGTTRNEMRDGAKLNGNAAPPEELWCCCVCRACEEICPVCVEHPRLLVDLRRRLIDQGEIDEGLQDALVNLQRYGNSFGQSPRKRTAWAKPSDCHLKDATKEAVDWLWFVGDYASYDPRSQRVTQLTAQLLQLAELNVGILREKEQNAGNDVRRVGEEGLFQLLREKNLKTLAKADYRRIVTTDPHTYNTLKHEYAANGAARREPWSAERPVMHYTQLFEELLAEGQLTVRRKLECRATYHDPCYLGRYNGVYDAPRQVLRTLGVTLVEMPRCRENSFCCGGGGGRIWMKDDPRRNVAQRPAEGRIQEALTLPKVDHFVVACPKDLAMFRDAVKTVGAEDRLAVVDLAELVFQAVGAAPQHEVES